MADRSEGADLMHYQTMMAQATNWQHRVQFELDTEYFIKADVDEVALVFRREGSLASFVHWAKNEAGMEHFNSVQEDVMVQTYGHACSCFTFDQANSLAEKLGSYERIVYGLNSEDPPDDPKRSADEAKKNHAAGIFGWRLDNDSSRRSGYYFPTFADAVEMWNLMH